MTLCLSCNHYRDEHHPEGQGCDAQTIIGRNTYGCSCHAYTAGTPTRPMKPAPHPSTPRTMSRETPPSDPEGAS